MISSSVSTLKKALLIPITVYIAYPRGATASREKIVSLSTQEAKLPACHLSVFEIPSTVVVFIANPPHCPFRSSSKRPFLYDEPPTSLIPGLYNLVLLQNLVSLQDIARKVILWDPVPLASNFPWTWTPTFGTTRNSVPASIKTEAFWEITKSLVTRYGPSA